jgi:multicomponent Na+:H+ antiporter subunit D
MEWSHTALPVLILASSLVTGLLIFPLREGQVRLRSALNMTGATVKVVLVVLLVWGVSQGVLFEARFSFMPGFDFVLRVDPISLIFAALSAGLWWLTTVYAIGYLERAPHRSRFFGFFSLCVTATMGVALAGNLLTFFIFYELLTVATYPLVVHRGTPQALAAGRTYLLYTLGGGMLLLAGVIGLHVSVGPVEFRTGGALGGEVVQAQATELTIVFALLIAGLGVKAALVPLHSWLPEAMVAPAPVSALLHAVAVVKAGAYGIIRTVHDLYGADVAAELGVLFPLSVVASITILYGSVRALRERELKRRLAYSTVSQVSYIVLGAALLAPVATIGALVHLVHQGLMKVTLFFCAGNLSEAHGIHRVDQLAGMGRRMPITMTAFTLTAFGMIGVPPVAGFISKWHLGLGAIDAGEPWVLGVLAASSILNAAYFLPLIHAAWFREPQPDRSMAMDDGGLEARRDAAWMLLVPPVATAGLALAAGVLAGMTFSPLDLARLAADSIWGAQ